MEGAGPPDSKVCPRCQHFSPTWLRICTNRDCSYRFAESTVASRIVAATDNGTSEAVSEIKGDKMETTFGVARHRSNSESSWENIDNEKPDSIEVVTDSMVTDVPEPSQSSQTKGDPPGPESEHKPLDKSRDPLQPDDKFEPFVSRAKDETGQTSPDALESTNKNETDGPEGTVTDAKLPNGDPEEMEGVIETGKAEENTKDKAQDPSETQFPANAPEVAGCPLAQQEDINDGEPMDQNSSVPEGSPEETMTEPDTCDPMKELDGRSEEGAPMNKPIDKIQTEEQINPVQASEGMDEEKKHAAAGPMDEACESGDSTSLITRNLSDIAAPAKEMGNEEDAREQSEPKSQTKKPSDNSPSEIDSVGALIAPPTASSESPDQSGNQAADNKNYNFMTPRITAQWPPPKTHDTMPNEGIAMDGGDRIDDANKQKDMALPLPPAEPFDAVKAMAEVDLGAEVPSQNIDSRYVACEFVVAVPAHVNLKDGDNVAMVFSDYTMGNWRQAHYMRLVATYNNEKDKNNTGVYSIRRHLPRRRLEYKYLVIRHNRNSPSQWEHEILHQFYFGDHNRTITAPDVSTGLSEIRRYDGCLEPRKITEKSGWFSSKPSPKSAIEIIHSDHAEFLQFLLPQFLSDRGFFTINLFGADQSWTLLTFADALLLICRLGRDFKDNGAVDKEDYYNILATYFTELLNKALVSNPLLQMAVALIFLRCMSVFGRDGGNIRKKMIASPDRVSSGQLCSMLRIRPAQGHDTASITQLILHLHYSKINRKTSLVDDLLLFMQEIKSQIGPLHTLPLYLVMRSCLPSDNAFQVLDCKSCLEKNWWGSAELDFLAKKDTQTIRTEIDAAIKQNLTHFKGQLRHDFARSVLFLYCTEPQEMIELCFAEYEPWLVIAWIAFRLNSKPKLIHHKEPSYEPFLQLLHVVCYSEKFTIIDWYSFDKSKCIVSGLISSFINTIKDLTGDMFQAVTVLLDILMQPLFSFAEHGKNVEQEQFLQRQKERYRNDLTWRWLSQTFPANKLKEGEFLLLTQLSQLKLSVLDVTLNERLCVHFEQRKRLFSAAGSEQILEWYCGADQNTIHASFRARLFDFIVRLIESTGANLLSADRMSSMSEEGREKMRRVISNIFVKNWPSGASDAFKLDHMIHWPLMPVLIRYAHGERCTLLLDDQQDEFALGVSLVQSMWQACISGDVSLDRLEQIWLRSTTVAQLVAISADNDSTAIEKQLDELYNGVYAQFKLLKNNLRQLIQLLEDHDLDPSDKQVVDDILNRGSSLNVNCVATMVNGQFELKPVIPPALETALQLVQERKLMTSRLYKNIWDELLKQQGKVRLVDMDSELFGPASQALIKQLKNIFGGTISLGEVQSLIDELPRGYLETGFVSEICNLSISFKIGSQGQSYERVQQMQRYLDLKQRSMDSSVLSDLFGALGLQQCQEEIHQLIELGTNLETKLLCDMTQSLENMIEKVQNIDECRGKCLKTFSEHLDFINWIRTEPGKNANDLMKFVDIASTNVGESDFEMAMVTDLGKAIDGYASLIYGIEECRNKHSLSLTQFLDVYLSPVWRALEQDPKLPAKLRDSAYNEAKLKTLYSATSSLSLFSIQQVEEINKIGCFHVGKIGQNIWQEDADTCIELLLNTDGENKRWSLKDLRDLRSKLMLIGGQMDDRKSSKQEIDSFTKMFDTVSRLATLYLKHCAAGNVLLSEFKCQLFCDTAVRYQVTATLHDQPPGFDSKCTQKITLIDQINELCDFLDDSLDEWNKYLDRMRADFPELNYFTSRQIVSLRRQLVRVSVRDELDKGSALILMALQPEINTKLVLQAIDQSITDLGAVEEEIDRPVPKNELNYMVQQLLDNGVCSRAVALKAIAAVGIEDIDTALEWALNYMEDEAHAEKQITEDPSFKEKLAQLTSQYHEMSDMETLAVILKRVWHQYLDMQEMRFKEMLGLRQLCYVLRNLASTKPVKELRCPKIIKSKTPNLAILPEMDIPRYILSLYDHASIDGTSLENLTMENVFVCNENTTAEEVRLFLLRIRNPIAHAAQCRLYAIVAIDRLSSHVCQAVETALDKDLREASEYGLVLVCSEEHSNHCHLAGVLSRYQLKTKDIMLNTPKAKRCVKQLLNHFGGTEPVDKLEDNLVGTYYNGFLSTSVGYGHGKSMCINSQEIYHQMDSTIRKIPIHSRILDIDAMFKEMKKAGLVELDSGALGLQRMIHIDVLDHRTKGIDIFLFQLLILGGFTDSAGNVWRRLPGDCYAIEMTSTANQLTNSVSAPSPATEFRFLLPTILCHSPTEILSMLQNTTTSVDESDIVHRLLDPSFLDSSVLRTYAYLSRQQENLSRYVYKEQEEKRSLPNKADVLAVLLDNCGVKEPSWTEFRHFIKFLNRQIIECEKSMFFSNAVASELPGFKNFVIQFLIQMSKDFATRSLKISEEVAQLNKTQQTFDQLEGYDLQQRWEESFHPYLFMNANHGTVSFFGCNFQKQGRRIDLVNFSPSQTAVIQENVMDLQLFAALRAQLKHDPYSNDFGQSFENKTQQEKLLKICRVLGLPDPQMTNDDQGPFTVNPDPNYEITADCALKMLAIEMRFRCGIPVVIMGETGCGKTRLIRYLCDLKSSGSNANNLIILRVHGGVTAEKINDVVLGAIEQAVVTRFCTQKETWRRLLDRIESAAETYDLAAIEGIVTEAVKIATESFPETTTTKIIDFVLQAIRQGVEDNQHGKMQTKKIIVRTVTRKMRCSTEEGLKTCLFFDEANTTTAITQIKEVVCDGSMDGSKLDTSNVDIIAAVNPYRRHSEEMVRKLEGAGLGYHIQDMDSLEKFGDIPMRRLVYRVQPLPPSMIPFVWDFGKLNDHTERIYIGRLVDRFVRSNVSFQIDDQTRVAITNVLARVQRFMKKEQNESAFVSLRDVERTLDVIKWFYDHKTDLYAEMDGKLDAKGQTGIDDHLTRSLILALCVCYRASLQSQREIFDNELVAGLQAPLQIETTAIIGDELDACQDVFIDNVRLQDNIAKNEALKENLFMMIICIELRIPLFLVGKPGSSKSLAKTIVAESMIGAGTAGVQRNEFFSKLKQAKLISYQCSPLATADGVEGIFRQGARAQMDVDLGKVVAVAVFDEIGLAEDSPLMPLKALHGLLEEGCAIKNEALARQHKCGFVGISNWALDPAKMNRGIFVNRVLPTQDELKRTAKIICQEGAPIYKLVKPLLTPLIEAYLELYEEQDKDYEFFGLRDFYSLVKMIYDYAARRHRQPSYEETMYAVQRNFGGKKGKNVPKIFERYLSNFIEDTGVDQTRVIELIKDNLTREPNKQRDNRFLLILTENYAAMRSLEDLPELAGDDETPPALTVFGSSFPQDLEYTQICRNINTIKICMDTGRTIVLLNLDSLYESLYDLLNQAFQMYSDERYVELGLGIHRLKCHVHEKFRLIVVAEAEEVRRCFPAALINRLEKHYISMRTDLNRRKRQLTTDLTDWATDYTRCCNSNKIADPSDVFVGYNQDTAAAIVNDICASDAHSDDAVVLQKAKAKLLQTAMPESVLLYYFKAQYGDADSIYELYFQKQHHNNLTDFLSNWTRNDSNTHLVQISTHASNVLAQAEIDEMAQAVGLGHDDVHVLTLQDYTTEQQFSATVQSVCIRPGQQLLIVQCLAAEQHNKLVACAHYILETHECANVWIVQLLLLQRQPFSLTDMLQRWLNEHIEPINQVATHNKLSTEEEGILMAERCGIQRDNVEVVLDRDHSFTKSLDRCLERAKVPDRKQLLIVQFLATEKRQPSRLAAECRAEISRKLSLPRNAGSNLRVLLLISLPRISSFPGRKWDSFHLDDLILGPTDLKDIGALSNRSISSIIANEHLLSRKKLLKECVCQAASMIQDDTERKVARIDILDDALERDEPLLDILATKLVGILEEGEDPNADKWLSKEASNSRQILERRTFRRSLRNRIENEIEAVLAQMLCILDVCNNLSLLNSDQLHDIWLSLFADSSFMIGMHYTDLMFERTSEGILTRKVCEIGNQRQHRYQCQFPFSWLLRSHMDTLMGALFEVTGNTEEHAQHLSEQVLDTTWGRSVANAPTAIAMRCYINDLVLASMTCNNTDSLLLMQWLYEQTEQFMERQQHVVCLAAVHLVNLELRDAMKQFLDFLEIECEDFKLIDLINNDRLLNENQFELDVCAALALIDQLNGDFEKADARSQTTEMNEAVARRLFDARRRWVALLRAYGPLVHRMLDDNNMQKHNDNTRQRLRNDRLDTVQCAWEKFGVCAMFVKHTMRIDYPLKLSPLRDAIEKCPNMCSEEFLRSLKTRTKTWNTMAFRYFFEKRAGKIECAVCKQLNAEPFGFLPCTHFIHQSCFNSLAATMCPLVDCQKKFPHQFAFRVETERWAKFIDSRQAITNFFIDFVSAKIFAIGQPPPLDVIKRLLEYVTGTNINQQETTAQLAPFADALSIDATPVIRSYMLQQLLKYNVNAIVQHIDEFIKNFDHFFTTNPEKLQFLLMCIACIQDSMHAQHVGASPADVCSSLCQRMQQIHELDHAPGSLEQLSVSNIAEMKFIVGSVAQQLPFIVSNHTDLDARNCVMMLEHLLPNKEELVRHYLLKCIGRLHGMNALTNYCKQLRWLNPDLDLQNDRKTGDVYLCHGEDYLNGRRALFEALINMDSSRIIEMDRKPFQLSLLPVLSEFEQLSDQRALFLQQSVTELELEGGEPSLIDQVLDLDRPLFDQLRLASNDDENVARLLYHAQVMCSSPPSTALWQFFHSLFVDPAAVQESYFPTMWEDHTAEIWKAQIAANRSKSTTLNFCPNGHPYFIDNCGRPVIEFKCSVCGQTVGGRRHAHVTGSYSADGRADYYVDQTQYANAYIDQTKHGHCLDHVNALGPDVPRERKLTQFETVTLRAILHVVMLAAGVSNPEGVRALCTLGLRADDDVCEFLRLHLEKNLEDLRRCWQTGVDECFYLLNSVLYSLFETTNEEILLQDPLLTNKDSRIEWENMFIEAFRQQNFTAHVQNLQNMIGQDTDDDPLWRIVHGVRAAGDGALDLHQLYSYHSPQTADKLLHLAQQQLNKDASDSSLAALCGFWEQMHTLSAVRFLPSILRLQEFLYQHLHGSVDFNKSESIGNFVQSFRDDRLEHDKLTRWIDDFFSAWRLVRDLVLQETFAFSTKDNRIQSMRLPEEAVPNLVDPYSNPLQCLLPIAIGQGLGSCTLTFCLIRIQNNFVTQHKEPLGLSPSLTPVALKQAFAGGQMLSFDIDQDIVPLLMMNRSIEFVVHDRSETDIFDLHALQRQLIAKHLGQLIFLKPSLSLMRTKQNILLECRNKLIDKVEQKEMSAHQVRDLIANVGNDLHRVKSCLDSAELLMRFVSSVDLPSDTELADFLSYKLGVRHVDELFHRFTLAELNALWTTLLFLNNMLVMVHDPEHLFTDVDQCFSSPLPELAVTELNESLKQSNQVLLLAHLTSFIILRINDVVANLGMEQKLRRVSGPLLDDFLPFEFLFDDEAEIDLPASVLLKHTLCTWRIAAAQFRQGLEI